MLEVKKILYKVLALIIDILLLGYKVIRQVVLPSRRRKGNLLSSLFILIICIIDRMVAFEQTILRVPKIFPMLFRSKYVKQGLQIAAVIFFFVCAFEGSGTKDTIRNEIALYPTDISVQTNVKAQKSINFNAALVCLKTDFRIEHLLSTNKELHHNFNSPLTARRYLRIRNLRI